MGRSPNASTRLSRAKSTGLSDSISKSKRVTPARRKNGMVAPLMFAMDERMVTGASSGLSHGPHDASHVRARVRRHAAAQPHGPHAAIVELPRIRLDLGHERVRIARHARAVPSEDHAPAPERVVPHAKRDAHPHDRIALLRHSSLQSASPRGTGRGAPSRPPTASQTRKGGRDSTPAPSPQRPAPSRQSCPPVARARLEERCGTTSPLAFRRDDRANTAAARFWAETPGREEGASAANGLANPMPSPPSRTRRRNSPR